MAIIRDHLYLDPVAAAGSPGKPGKAHGLLRCPGAGCIRHETHSCRNMGHNTRAVFFHAPQGNGDYLRAAGRGNFRDYGVIAKFACADKKAAIQSLTANNKWIVHA